MHSFLLQNSAKRVRPAKEHETLTFDLRFLKQNRELRDRYLERVNSEPLLLACEGGGKYDVSRAPASSSLAPRPPPLAPRPCGNVALVVGGVGVRANEKGKSKKQKWE